jgi:hypothetical protein
LEQEQALQNYITWICGFGTLILPIFQQQKEAKTWGGWQNQ